MKIVFFGSSDFTISVLNTLHENSEIVAVVTTPDAPIGRKQVLSPTPIAIEAGRLGIKVYKPASLKDPSVQTELANLNADLFVVASYGKIIPQQIIDLPKYKTINLHPSLLPKYRGATPIQTALLNSESVTGGTIILMDKEVDHGPIIDQFEYNIRSNEKFSDLAKALFSQMAERLPKLLADIETGNIKIQEQNHEQATFTKLLSKQDGLVSWSDKTATEIYDQFRAYDVWPGLWTNWNDKIVKILECEIGAQKNPEQAGKVLDAGIVECKNGTTLKLLKIQVAGKPATDIQSFIRGNKQLIGSLFT